MIDAPVADLVAADGGSAEVLRCWRQARSAGRGCVLAVVFEVSGSAYVAPGTLLLFGETGRLRGWLSGGCLERQVETHAAALLAGSAESEWVEIDQRDEDALLAPSASGCRGRIRLLLIGPALLEALGAPLEAALEAGSALELSVMDAGILLARCGQHEARTAVVEWPWPGPAAGPLRIPAPPRLILLGAGAEAPVLVPLLRSLGWRVEAVEQRPSWVPLLAGVDRLVEDLPERGLAGLAPGADDPVLVMHHEFERDRAALAALACAAPRWIGLLGPASRRKDLFKVLPAASVAALEPRLESPVGLDLGGKGPAAIALSIAASLQRWRHGR